MSQIEQTLYYRGAFVNPMSRMPHTNFTQKHVTESMTDEMVANWNTIILGKLKNRKDLARNVRVRRREPTHAQSALQAQKKHKK